MCFRYSIKHPPEEIEQKLGLDETPTFPDVAWIGQGDNAPVFRWPPDDFKTIEHIRWGLHVPWANAATRELIHITSENLSENRLLKTFLDVQTCVMPSSGFYAWRGSRGQRKAHYICREDRAPLLFAGVVCSWISFKGKELTGCAMLTTEADKTLLPEANRMPFILSDNDLKIWLQYDLENQLECPCPISPSTNDLLYTYLLPAGSPSYKHLKGRVHPRAVKAKPSNNQHKDEHCLKEQYS